MLAKIDENRVLKGSQEICIAPNKVVIYVCIFEYASERAVENGDEKW